MNTPTFNVSEDGKTVEVDGTVYQIAQRELDADSRNFRRGTFGQGLNFLNSLYINSDKRDTKIWLNGETFSLYDGFYGNTRIRRVGELIVVQDNPDLTQNPSDEDVRKIFDGGIELVKGVKN